MNAGRSCGPWGSGSAPPSCSPPVLHGAPPARGAHGVRHVRRQEHEPRPGARRPRGRPSLVRYDVGDVVAYRNLQLDTVVLHRIVAREGERYVLQGDSNTWLDS